MKAVFISCTILENQRTSVYSHKVALIKDGELHFQKDELASLNITQLIHPDIDEKTRKIKDSDLFAENLYPIYSGTKISL